ncbi:MAG: ATP-dependent helicase [Pseudomonas sp.]|nr:ATP-dependent helicase [Pseudomonas sp.]
MSGTGKTTSLTRYIGEAAEKYDPDKIIVASFTRAAAKELIGRDLPIKSDQVGTLHAICYRMLGNPDIAESKTKDFNEQYPHFAVTQSDTVRMDDGLAPTDEGAGQNSGDDLLAQLGIYRARMVRKELWSPTVLDFHRAWEGYKRDCNLADFQDLIDRALEVHYPPFQAQIGIFDEVQDFTPVQLKLIRRWAKYMEWILMAGDDDQTLYSFTGATPEAFLNPPVGEEFKRVLRQSYRVPTKVLHLANRIIAKIRVREPKEYRPRDHDGKIFTSNATWKKPDNVIPVIKGYVAEGKRVMVLATCSYMLGPLIAQLRDRGIPFSNIYKANRGDWNPIRKRQTGNAGAYGRLCAYMAPQGAEFQGVRLWTPGQLESWTEPIRVDGNFQRGAKSKLREMCKTKELAPEVVLGAMLEALSEEAFDNAVSFDLEWFLSQITPAKQKAYDFPSRVYKECGLDGPEMAKMCTVGTVHSVKGAESDVVILFPDISLRGAQHYAMRQGEQFEQILRQFYVGVTRTRDILVLCQGLSRGMFFDDYK